MWGKDWSLMWERLMWGDWLLMCENQLIEWRRTDWCWGTERWCGWTNWWCDEILTIDEEKEWPIICKRDCLMTWGRTEHWCGWTNRCDDKGKAEHWCEWTNWWYGEGLTVDVGDWPMMRSRTDHWCGEGLIIDVGKDFIDVGGLTYDMGTVFPTLAIYSQSGYFQTLGGYRNFKKIARYFVAIFVFS